MRKITELGPWLHLKRVKVTSAKKEDAIGLIYVEDGDNYYIFQDKRDGIHPKTTTPSQYGYKYSQLIQGKVSRTSSWDMERCGIDGIYVLESSYIPFL